MCRSARASDRKTKIQALETQGDPLWALYQEASDAAETASAVARKSGQYPLLGRGDLNIYSLFVERALDLVQPKGIVGLLVPSGIASDKTASEFFRSVSTTGRLAALLDFENQRVFFPDVDSRFKFSVFVVGGPRSQFGGTDCAYFLHSVDELEQSERIITLGPRDFAAVNPNTGTAPVFRSRRDGEITTAVYRHLPVLVDRSGEEEVRTWPVDYLRMFDMTNDSHLFMTAEELDQDGAYRVENNRWKKGDSVYVPLYEGKMVQSYDHRAASVERNPDNLHRPAQPVPATPAEHQDSTWLPTPQYWVPRTETAKHFRLEWTIGFKEITSPTNIRTMIAAAFPAVGFGNKVPILQPLQNVSLENYKRLVYGITRTEADYILNQFPIVREDDEKEFSTFRTRDLILGYKNAVEAGDLNSRIKA